MTDKMPIAAIAVDAVMQATFWANSVAESKFRFRATHLDGKRSPKVVLSDDPRIRPGIPCLVKVVAIRKPRRDDRGAIEVAFVQNCELQIQGIYLDPIVSKKLQVLLESGLNILLDGPQGCGKTVLAKAVSEQLGMRFVFFNCGAVVEASDFLATIQVRASEDGHPVTDFIPTEILTAMADASTEPARSFLIFLDEFNRCPENARNALMPALDATRRVFNPMTNQFLSIPDNVQFIAAVNRGGEFSGTYGIDAAQLDRFAPLQMDYLPEEEETRLLGERHPEVPKHLIRTIVELANQIRDSEELPGGLSVRATDEACIYLKHPLFENDQRHCLGEILRSSFCGRFPGRWDDANTEAGICWSAIHHKLEDA